MFCITNSFIFPEYTRADNHRSLNHCKKAIKPDYTTYLAYLRRGTKKAGNQTWVTGFRRLEIHSADSDFLIIHYSGDVSLSDQYPHGNRKFGRINFWRTSKQVTDDVIEKGLNSDHTKTYRRVTNDYRDLDPEQQQVRLPKVLLRALLRREQGIMIHCWSLLGTSNAALTLITCKNTIQVLQPRNVEQVRNTRREAVKSTGLSKDAIWSLYKLQERFVDNYIIEFSLIPLFIAVMFHPLKKHFSRLQRHVGYIELCYDTSFCLVVCTMLRIR